MLFNTLCTVLYLLGRQSSKTGSYDDVVSGNELGIYGADVSSFEEATLRAINNGEGDFYHLKGEPWNCTNVFICRFDILGKVVNILDGYSMDLGVSYVKYDGVGDVTGTSLDGLESGLSGTESIELYTTYCTLVGPSGVESTTAPMNTTSSNETSEVEVGQAELWKTLVDPSLDDIGVREELAKLHYYSESTHIAIQKLEEELKNKGNQSYITFIDKKTENLTGRVELIESKQLTTSLNLNVRLGEIEKEINKKANESQITFIEQRTDNLTEKVELTASSQIRDNLDINTKIGRLNNSMDEVQNRSLELELNNMSMNRTLSNLSTTVANQLNETNANITNLRNMLSSLSGSGEWSLDMLNIRIFTDYSWGQYMGTTPYTTVREAGHGLTYKHSEAKTAFINGNAIPAMSYLIGNDRLKRCIVVRGTKYTDGTYSYEAGYTRVSAQVYMFAGLVPTSVGYIPIISKSGCATVVEGSFGITDYLMVPVVKKALNSADRAVFTAEEQGDFFLAACLGLKGSFVYNGPVMKTAVQRASGIKLNGALGNGPIGRPYMHCGVASDFQYKCDRSITATNTDPTVGNYTVGTLNYYLRNEGDYQF
jgi:uncharacterized protein YoxC